MTADGGPPTGTAAKRYTRGTHRVCAPEETLAAPAAAARPMGITRIAERAPASTASASR